MVRVVVSCGCLYCGRCVESFFKEPRDDKDKIESIDRYLCQQDTDIMVQTFCIVLRQWDAARWEVDPCCRMKW